jgi:D-glycero-D-manno-heptose 1,7-bisphosphate phosphatase
VNSKAVFLDKDGTLIEDVPYNVDPELIHLSKGAVECLRTLQEKGYCLIVVTNQSGVARGYFEETELIQVEMRLRKLLSSEGIYLTGFYYCPHHPDGEVSKYAVDCFCRKPHPGMLYRAALEHHVNLSASWLVGDILNDIEAGNRVGCRTVLVDNAHETEWKITNDRTPEFIVKDLISVANIIAKESLIEWNLEHG